MQEIIIEVEDISESGAIVLAAEIREFLREQLGGGFFVSTRKAD